MSNNSSDLKGTTGQKQNVTEMKAMRKEDQENFFEKVKAGTNEGFNLKGKTIIEKY